MPRPRRPPLRLLAVLVAAGVLAVAALPGTRRLVAARLSPGLAQVREALAGRGGVVQVGEPPWGLAATEDLVDPGAAPPVAEALAGEDPARLAAALRSAGHDTLLVRADAGAGGGGLAARLARAEHLPGLRGVVLSPAAHVYAVDPRPPLGPVVEAALARVARAVVGGARAPRVSSFPEAARAPGNVEVMVLLRERGRARLWRSARSSSVARGLVTAALVARRRWAERERAMGGPLDDKLPWLDVELALLSEDGTLAARSPGFVERVFTPAHGVAYERKGAWRYLLPGATWADGSTAVQAYERLFVDHGLPAESLGRRDLRLYRLVSETLARSPAPRGASRGASAGD